MKKYRQIKVAILIAIMLITLSMLLFFSEKNVAYAEDEKNRIAYEGGLIFDLSETINLSFDITNAEDIEFYNLESNGFSCVYDYLLEDELVVGLSLIPEKPSYKCNIEVVFCDNFKSKIIINGYILDNQIVIDINIEDQIYQVCFKDEYQSINGYDNATTNSRIVRSEGDTYLRGKMEWKDSFGIRHPLYGVLLSIIDVSDISAIRSLGKVYTDIDGSFDISFVNAIQGSKLLIFAYTEGEKVKVADTDEYVYFTSFVGPDSGVSTGATVIINGIIDMTTITGQAFQITQALFYMRDFAYEMSGVMPTDVVAMFPYVDPLGIKTTCFYRRSEKTIYINTTTNSTTPINTPYQKWDTLMHEYAHHLQYDFGIINTPGGVHSSNVNDADARNNKSDGIRLAWAESWPSVAGELAQQYYSANLQTVFGVADEYYNSANEKYNTYTTTLGEACEQSIMAVLWDLYDEDSATEPDDTIALGYQGWWDVTTGSGATTFSEFIEYLYTQNPSYKESLAPNLTKYQMAPTAPVVERIDGSDYPRFTWDPQGGSVNYPNNSFILELYDENRTSPLTIQTTSNYVNLGSIHWDVILGWGDETFYGRVIGNQTSTPATGPYYSPALEFTIPLFVTSKTAGGKMVITDYFGPIPENYGFPSTLQGCEITRIEEMAFNNLSGVTTLDMTATDIETIGRAAFTFSEDLALVGLPNTLVTLDDLAFAFGPDAGIIIVYSGSSWTTIGGGAFYRTKLPSLQKLPASIVSIGDNAFYESSFYTNFRFSPNNLLTSIGANAFYNTNITNLAISSRVTYVGSKAFNGIADLTLYVEHSSKPSGWASDWNYSNRPVIWGCTLSADRSYVVSVNKTSSSISNASAEGGINTPYREDYTFGGWYTTADFSGTSYDDITQAPNGTLYAKWTEKSCVAEGTLITLADGSQVAVEELTGNEELLVWNMLTGTFDSAPILFIDSDPLETYQIIELTFSDDTKVKVIDEHAFWCFELNKYVYLDENASDYIGYHFNKKTQNGYTSVELIAVDIYNQTTRAYSPITYGHLCYYVNGMLSMPGGITGFINIFEVDETSLKYDATAMANDIATYGLYTYAEFTQEIAEVPEEIFLALNGQHLKVAIGKGLISEEQILLLIERYAEFF